MMKFKRITTKDEALYTFMEQLMVASFPAEEYRDLNELRTFTDTKKRFYNNIIFDNNQPIGLITYWDFDEFYYVEHFAIDPAHRNGGIGKRALESIFQQLDGGIILEVEEPVEEMAQRRINFYKRLGFKLWDKPYLQPPYRKGDDFLPLLLMAHGDLDADKQFENIKRTIYKEVYNIL